MTPLLAVLTVLAATLAAALGLTVVLLVRERAQLAEAVEELSGVWWGAVFHWKHSSKRRA